MSHSSGEQKSWMKVLAGPHSLWMLQGRISPCLFRLPVAPGIPWLVSVWLPSPPLSTHGLLSSVCLCLFLLPLLRTLAIGFRVHLTPAWFNPEILILNTFAKPLFKSWRFQGFGFGHILWKTWFTSPQYY